MKRHLNRNDAILLAVFVVAVSALLLLAYAPVTNPPVSLVARVWAVVESPISIAIVSTVVAAFAGTWGAQILAEWTQHRKELLAEIRGTNAAIALAMNIANTYIIIKKQHIEDLVAQYKAHHSQRKNHMAAVAAGAISPVAPFTYNVEFKTILTPFSPHEALQLVLMERVSDLKTQLLLTPLSQSIQSFRELMDQRNQWIAEVKALPTGADNIKARMYFGDASGTGQTDARYANFVEGLEVQTDSIIGFSILITRTLKRHGDRLVEQFGDDAPKISSPQFDQAEDLLPDMAQFSSWIEATK